MRPIGRLGRLLSAVVVGVLVGGGGMLWANDTLEEPDVRRDLPRAAPPPDRRRTIDPAPSAPAPSAPRTSILLAWAPGGLPAGAERAVESARGVREATTVVTGLDWLTRSRDGDGTTIDESSLGSAVPLDTAYVERDEYARFVPPGDRAAILRLGRGDVLLPTTGAELRRAGPGSRFTLRDRTVRVTGIVGDDTTQGYELLGAGPPPRSWASPYAYVLARTGPGIERSAVARRLTTLLDPGQRLRLRFRGETPFLRYGDAVLPQLLLKEAFGEFAARPLPGGTIEVESPWRERNIVRAAVPILGRITCHRSLFPQLRDALEDVDSRGLGFTIDPGDFGGCYSPRFIGSDVNGRLSHHSWGIAFDLNASENPFGTRPNLDERLIEIFESHGFTWGGRWLIPDGMHFEWVSFPSR